MEVIRVDFPQEDVCRITVCEDGERYEAATQALYEKRGHLYPIRDYPKGERPPREVIEERYGIDTFRMPALNDALTYEYPALQAKVCEERQLYALTQPEPELLELSKDGYTVACTFALLPVWEMKSYKGQRISGTEERLAVAALAEQIAAASQLAPSPYAVEVETENRRTDLEERLGKMGETVNGFLKTLNKTQEEFERDLRGGTVRALNQQIVLYNIARQEGLLATETELEQEIQRMEALSAKNSYVRTNLSAQQAIKGRLTNEKAIRFLKEENTITVTTTITTQE